MVKTFQDLKVWQKAHQLVLEIYKITSSFPENEKYGLISQMRRAAVSVPANLAEGFKRQSNRDFAHFVNISAASLEEVRYHLLLSSDLEYMDALKKVVLEENCDEVARMLYALQRHLKVSVH